MVCFESTNISVTHRTNSYSQTPQFALAGWHCIILYWVGLKLWFNSYIYYKAAFILMRHLVFFHILFCVAVYLRITSLSVLPICL